MEKVKWDDSLSIGIQLIDDQHKALIQRLSDVCEAASLRQGTREILKTLDFLVEYTEHHFSDEEKHMQETNYPGLEKQKREHQEFNAILKDMNRDFDEEGAIQALADSIQTLLMNWLATHIKVVDKEFGKFLMENNIEIAGEV